MPEKQDLVTVERVKLNALIKQKQAAEKRAAEAERDMNFLLKIKDSIMNYFETQSLAKEKLLNAQQFDRLPEVLGIDRGEYERFKKKYKIDFI